MILLLQGQDLLSPPMGDQALGVWDEGHFLAETRFDYVALVNAPGEFESGPNGYVVTVLPAIVAVFQLLFSARGAIVAYHLFTFACAAYILFFVYRCLAVRGPTLWAILLSGALATTPAFRAQVALLGMDVPMVACTCFAAHLFARNRDVAGILGSAAAALVKQTGVTAVPPLLGTVGFEMAARFVLGSRLNLKTARRFLAIGAAAAAICILLSMGIKATVTKDKAPDPQNIFANAPRIDLAPWLCPDLVTLLGVAALGTAIRLAGTGLRPALQALVDGHEHEFNAPRLLVASWLIVCMTILTVSGPLFTVRYLTIAMPFLFLVLGFVYRPSRAWLPLASVAGASLIAFNVANASGKYFPSLAEGPPIESAGEEKNLERSLEFRAYLNSNIGAAALMSREFSDAPLVADVPYSHFFGLPYMGYVERPLHGWTSNTAESIIPTFKPRESRGDKLFDDVVFVRNRWSSDLPPYEPGDELIYEDRLSSPLRIYRKTWRDDPPASLEAARDWYAERGWFGSSFAERAYYRSLWLSEAGRNYRAVKGLLPTLADEASMSPLVRANVARLLTKLGAYDAAQTLASQGLDRGQQPSDLQLILATASFLSRRYITAEEYLDQLVADDPAAARSRLSSEYVKLRVGIADQWVARGDRTRALRQVDAALAVDPAFQPALNLRRLLAPGPDTPSG